MYLTTGGTARAACYAILQLGKSTILLKLIPNIILITLIHYIKSLYVGLKLVVVNRSADKAAEVAARFHGTAINMEDLQGMANANDLCVSSTSSL
jgi:shikimate 5-dehydrogenase